MGKKLKQQVIEHVKIDGMAAEGRCVGRKDGMVIFVKWAAPGDLVDVQVTRNRGSYLEGFPVHYHEYSTVRNEPFCQHFGVCGGCRWQHIDYQTQLHYKWLQVKDNLERIGKVELPEIRPILPSPKTRFYRNKLEFTFSNKRWLTEKEVALGNEYNRNGCGFHMPRKFDKILDIQKCFLQPDPSNTIRLAAKKYAIARQLPFFDLIKQTGLLRNLIVRTSSIGEIMVIVLFFYNDEEAIEGLMSFLRDTFPEITSLLYVINPKKNETFQDLDVVTYSGRDFIWEEMTKYRPSSGRLRFRVGPKSFFQTNSDQAQRLYQKALEFAHLSGQETVYDLYTGTGTIALFSAEEAKKVVGIEFVEEAIDDAKQNAIANDIENAQFYAGDVKKLMNDEFLDEHGRPDVVMTDPPRAGMHTDVVKTLLRVQPERLVYISCNPATQARDINLLNDKFSVVAVQPVDMFPHTHHVENITLLMRRNGTH